MLHTSFPALAIIFLSLLVAASPAAEPEIVNIWPEGRAPNDNAPPGEEHDTTKEGDQLIAGKRVARIGNVSVPTIAVYRPPAEKANGAAIVICPGGGHYILAYDLEGTEVAEWANTLGITAIVLKYRVPARDKDRRWLAAVQDAQRAMSLVRGKAIEWKLDPKRIGILGFSAGGEAAARTALAQERLYVVQNAGEEAEFRPDFAILVYPAGLVEKDNSKLRDDVVVTSSAPPMFFAHAFDDRARIENSLLVYLALKKADVPAELHAYSTGGHGFGLRKTEAAVTEWPARCEAWLRAGKIISR